MSKLAWERAASSAAKLATVSVVAALAATTSVSAENATKPSEAQKVPASYGQTYGQPSFGAPVYGQPTFGQPAWGQPQQFGAPAAAWGQPQGIAPAATSTYAPAGAPAHKMPAHAAHAPQGQMPHPQFGQRLPIFANTQANGITSGPPSYTPQKDFDPKMASSSPFPSSWGQPQLPGRAPMPNLAGAPVYGGYNQQVQPATYGQYAPAEPTYAPAEPLRPNYSAAPAAYAPAAPAQPTYESVDVTPAAAPVEAASSYSYEMAPATSAPSYVGTSTELGSATYAPAATTSANPYEVVIGQTGTTSYEAAPAYQAAPAYETQATGAYEMTTTAPAYQQATTYSAQGYETVTTAPSYEAAPAYQSAPAYQAALPSTDYGTSSFSSGNSHFVQVGAFRNPARAERLVRKLQGAGEQPIVTQATVRGKLYHRVRVPAMDKRDAKSVQSRIRGLGYYEARMVRG